MSRFHKFLLIGYVIAAVLLVSSLIAAEPYQGYIPDPVQTNLAEAGTITVAGEEGDVELSLLAEYAIEGVVKSKKKYSDYPAQVARYDFALAWGDLNKEEIDEYIKYSQSGRWCHYRYSLECPVNQEYISSHSANVHLIHKDEDILNKIKRVRKNEYVQLKGYLVNVNFKDGPWKSSLTRTDTGNGACEIMYVTNIAVRGEE